jgi:hypothetical protein
VRVIFFRSSLIHRDSKRTSFFGASL